MDVRKVVREVAHNVRTFGLDAALRDVGFRAANKLVPVSILKGMTAVLDDVNPFLFDPGRYIIRFAAPEELRRAARRPEWRTGMAPGQVEMALGKGDEAVGCFDGDRLVCVGWYAQAPTPVSDTLTLQFDPVWVYMHRGFTLPEHRGRRLHALAMTCALQAYTARGARGLISYVDFNNLPSLRSVERMGYRIFGEIVVVAIGRREFTMPTPGCRPYGFRLVPAASAADAGGQAADTAAPGDAASRLADDPTSRYEYPAASSRPWRQ
jgi:hypothetical protein